MPIEKESPEEKGYDTILYNLAESSVTDILYSELNIEPGHLKLEYTSHRGKPELRELIVQGQPGLLGNDVLLTNGAAGALFIIHSALLNAGDHIIVVRPNYATNIEVPKAIGCSISYINLQFDEQWRMNLQSVLQSITPATKLISITSPHNPTGMLMGMSEIDELIKIAEEKNIMLLADETYRDACFITPYPLLASLSKNVISVSSLSKAYGLPGLRMGWLITKNEEMYEQFLAAKEMIYITNSVLDEEIAYRFYLQKNNWLKKINAHAQNNLDILRQWLQDETSMEYVLPEGGVVCFPRFKKDIMIDAEFFHSILQNKYKTMTGPGHWFEMPDTYMRIGFGWTNAETLKQGLQNITLTIDACMQNIAS